MIDKSTTKSASHDVKDAEIDLLLSYIDTYVDDQDISVMRGEYDHLMGELRERTVELNHIIDLHDLEGVRWKSLHGEFSVYEQEIKGIKDELLLLRKRNFVLKDTELVVREFEEQEAMLSELTEREHLLAKEVSEFSRKTEENRLVIGDMDARLKEITSEIVEKNPEKDKLSEEVQGLGRIAKVFIEKDELESELRELNQSLTTQADEMTLLEKTIQEDDHIILELGAGIERLEEEITPLRERFEQVETLLSERASFMADIEGLKEELKPISARGEALQREHEAQTEALKEQSLVTADLKKSIADLEIEIENFEQTMREIGQARKKLKDAAKSEEQAISDLQGLFMSKATMENKLLLMEETIRTVIQSVEAVK